MLLQRPCFPGSATGKESACRCQRHKRCRFNPWIGKNPWRRTHFSILAWKIPWTEESDRLQSMGLQRVEHDWTHTHSTASVQRPRFTDALTNLPQSSWCCYKYPPSKIYNPWARLPVLTHPHMHQMQGYWHWKRALPSITSSCFALSEQEFMAKKKRIYGKKQMPARHEKTILLTPFVEFREVLSSYTQ